MKPQPFPSSGPRQIRKFVDGRILFLLCAGSYATNLSMVLIRTDDPPAEAGFFLALDPPQRSLPTPPFTLRPEFSL
ncbi:hypothetical protein [Mesorhizobium sp. M0909]|uniref:hypothetical protein n=1 Tax=Mesorhizobium sp. M0909 TaxID=2957024 RepID=UPI0033370427